MQDKRTVTVQMPPELHAGLEKLASMEGRSMAAVVRTLIHNAVLLDSAAWKRMFEARGVDR